MKKLLLLISLLLATNAWAYNETDLMKLKTLNACEGCDLSGINLKGADLKTARLDRVNLSGADLSGANLSDTDLTTSNLRDVKLSNAILCRTQFPWGEVNDGCR